MDSLQAFVSQPLKGSAANPHNEALQGQIQRALDLICTVLTLFPLEMLALTFNGGKDACVVFHLVRLALRLRGVAEGEASGRLKVLYFSPEHGDFPEVISFMAKISEDYHVTYTTYPAGTSFKDGMRDLVEKQGLKAVFLGVRRGDPHSCAWKRGGETEG
ncbi:fad synthetase, partial [Nannochloropsis gaditana]